MRSLAENTSQLNRVFLRVGILSSTLVCLAGFLLAIWKGGADLKVFYQAWFWVWNGHFSEIYVKSPDRFLYAPGFAWILAPLAAFPFDWVLAGWCLVKMALLAGISIQVTLRLKEMNSPFWAVGTWGTILAVRPVLIDFQYGQVNLMILGATAWAILGKREKRSAYEAMASWSLLSLLAATKLYPLPLLTIPWLSPAQDPKLRSFERAGTIMGAAILIILPYLFLPAHQATLLHKDWLDALRSKGIPTETHNQSILSFLYHFFSGLPTYAHQLGGPLKNFTIVTLKRETLAALGWGWTLISSGFLLGWIVKGPGKDPLRWGAIAIALTIVPSHLIWKPYFVLAIPCAAYVAVRSAQDWIDSQPLTGAIIALIGFALMNLMSFDIIGVPASVLMETMAVLLIAHLTWIGLAISMEPSNAKSHRISR